MVSATARTPFTASIFFLKKAPTRSSWLPASTWFSAPPTMSKPINNQFSIKGLDLRPGFEPPAGNASGTEVGGVSTMNVCVSSNGANNGQIYGKTVRSVPVKPGDTIQIEVKQGRAAVDKPAETGGKEVSGFLKYYVGSPTSPRRVGGIELDYADQEAEYLPPFAANDLPSVVVSDDIAKGVQARQLPRHQAPAGGPLQGALPHHHLPAQDRARFQVSLPRLDSQLAGEPLLPPPVSIRRNPGPTINTNSSGRP